MWALAYMHTSSLIAIASFGRWDDMVGNPHRAQISQFELFELFVLSKLDKEFPVEEFEATVSQSAVPSSPLTQRSRGAGVRPNSVESPRGICLAAAPHYRTGTLSKRLPKTKKASYPRRWRASWRGATSGTWTSPAARPWTGPSPRCSPRPGDITYT